jgi:hypothetical protein
MIAENLSGWHSLADCRLPDIDRMQVAAQELPALKPGKQSRPSQIVNHSKLSECRSGVISPMMTRLKGKVKDLPHVQPSILEYKSKEKTGNF